MYLYFDNNGILKEIVDDVATRKGNNEVNRLYIYVDGITPKTEWITYQTSDDVKSNETLIETTITKTIPYDRNRDLKYFKNFQEYLFYVATIPSSVLTVSGLTKASVRVALQDDSLMTLGLIIFTIEESVVLQDSFITESQYQYLLNIISNFEELNNTGVIGISTQIINGAVAPYDQGRIVLSTYNDNFTVATVVKNSTSQNVYNVLDMTFVKQVPYDNSKPNLEGLEINGRKYKVAYKTSQLNNDAGFITNAVSNLINYYTKTTVDEKLANIDLSEYYTKTESDGRYVLTTNFSWNNLANKPTSLSDFINDEGFITNTVSNLSNYYDKTTIDNIVSTLKTGAFQVVSELPSTGVEGVVYLVGTEAPYTMYIWENNAFLNIGTTEVNLDGYVKGTNLNANYVILGNGGSNVVASVYTINNQNANDPNSLLTAKVINTLLGTKQDVLTGGQGINISDNTISTPVSTTSTTISEQSVNKLKYDGKPILVDYAISDDSGRNFVDTYATFNDLHTLDIGDITSSSNIYQTLYQKVYENDTTKKNVVIFSTEGFVDSATSLISSGEHIATPYQDNKILIDSLFVLNSDNSATSIVSSDTVVIDLGTLSETGGTLSSEILAQINNNLTSKSISFEANISGTSITTATYFVSANMIIISALASSTIHNLTIKLTDGRYEISQVILLDNVDTKTINNTSLLGAGNIAVQEPLVSGTNIKTVNGQSLLGSGDIEISGSSESNTVVIDLGTLEGQTGTLSPDIVSEINNAISGNKHFVLKVNAGFEVIFPNLLYVEGNGLYAVSFSVSGELSSFFISIDLSSRQYIFSKFELQEKLVSGTNIKTINGQTILGAGNIEISGGGESDSITIDLGTITNINTHTPAYILSSDEKSSIDNAYNNNKIVYVKFNYTNENNNTETIILPIESKVAQTGGAYTYYGGGTLQNHEVWSFYISATSVFVNNITNTHRTKLFDLGTLSQLTGTLSNASEIANAFNSGYTPIIKFTYNGTTYYFAEPSGTYNSSSNTGSLNWISILSDKTIEKLILNFPAGNYTLSNEELGGGGGLTLPSTSPSSQLIPSITTSNEQQNLTIGNGLVVDNGALKTISTKYYEITITRNLFDYNGKTTDEKANYVSYATDYTLKFIIDETNYNALLNSISTKLGFTVDTEYLINNYNTLKQTPEYISGIINLLKVCVVGSISSITNSTNLAYINNCCYIAIPSIEGEDSWFKCSSGFFGTLCAYDADNKKMAKIGWDSVAENSTLIITTKYL